MLAITRGGSAYEHWRSTKIYFAWDNGLIWFTLSRSFFSFYKRWNLLQNVTWLRAEDHMVCLRLGASIVLTVLIVPLAYLSLSMAGLIKLNDACIASSNNDILSPHQYILRICYVIRGLSDLHPIVSTLIARFWIFLKVELMVQFYA